jgi:hypothetical protein
MLLRKILINSTLVACTQTAWALSMGTDEFHASRAMACVLAEESLGHLSETEYGARTHEVLDGFDDAERDAIIAKALGYYDGLMFAIPGDDPQRVHKRLRVFVGSDACREGVEAATVRL